ncbi:MAG: hypothetical protein K5656_12470 [Lachnospiraceae bacterium]|nr:hypothetical protein [Lachnospiraceae bacterium]
MRRIIAMMVAIIYVVTIAFSNVNIVDAETDFVNSWSVNKDNDSVIITIQSNDKKSWGYDPQFQNYPLNIEADGTDYSFTITYGGEDIKGAGWTEVTGAKVTKTQESAGDKLVVEIPLSYFNNASELTVKYNDEEKELAIDTEAEATEAEATEAKTTEAEATELEATEADASEADQTEAESTEAKSDDEDSNKDNNSEAEPGSAETSPSTASDISGYNGIVIDGDFSDWDGIGKADFVGTSEGYNGVVSAAIVFDGDVYIYLEDNEGYGNAAWSGPNNNGKYAIISDLGKQIIFDLDNDGSSTGVDGVTSTRNGKYWEIKVPADQIPKNNGSISFGYYLGEPTFTNVVNIKETEKVTVGDIKYDYSYADWEGFPHTVIEYDTAGTGNKVVDSHASIHLSDTEVLGHIETNHPSHVNSKGSDLLYGVHITVNGEYDMEWRVAAVDAAGNINWHPQTENLSNGSYEYYIFDTHCWGTSTNINDLNDHDVCFGKTYLTVSDDSLEMEWAIDSKTLADFFGIDETDLRVVSSTYMRIGKEVVDTAGVSTGGLPAALGCIGLAYFLTRRARRKEELEV